MRPSAKQKQGTGTTHLRCLAYILPLVLVSFALSVIGTPASGHESESGDDFYVKPYLQIGNECKSGDLELLWVAKSNHEKWKVEARESGEEKWHAEQAPTRNFIATPHLCALYRCSLKGLKPGEPFQYRLLRNGNEAFAAGARALKEKGQSCRVVLFGDMGANTEGERKVAYQIFTAKPDFIVLLGDIVYDFGLYSEYLNKFFPIYNCAEASLKSGAPLLRSVVSIGVLGNHDVALGDNPLGVNLEKFADGLAYFKIWSQPLNGPLGNGAAHNVPRLLGADANKADYLKQTRDNYPRMANYSFDYGDAHWLVLDANPYMDWTDSELRDWVAKDLTQAQSAKWKFVCFHQPGFSFDVSHYKEQRMRLLCDIFEKGGVDIVFAGHAHNYQRSFPLHFKVRGDKGGAPINSDGTVDGDFLLDKQFDGRQHCVPNGIIYLVSGAGGAKLYPSADTKDHTLKRVFTDIFNSDTHSFTILDISATQLSFVQQSEDGAVIDSFRVSKSGVSKSSPVSANTVNVNRPAAQSQPVNGVNQ